MLLFFYVIFITTKLHMTKLKCLCILNAQSGMGTNMHGHMVEVTVHFQGHAFSFTEQIF